jgi:DHA1 family multidrug resistance protein-like MFS transporter
MSTLLTDRRARVSAWLQRWRPLLPVFGAEFIVLIGFGALLPVLPLFIRDQGIDPAQLGLIIAAWPIAKLFLEPVFGWWADRYTRKPQMVAALLVLAVVSVLPLVFTSFAALFILRFLAGAAAAAYDPAARGMLTEATHEGERGEAFGVYAAFQIGGFAIGPAIGGIGAALIEGYAFPFAITGLLSVVGAVVMALRLEPNPRLVGGGVARPGAEERSAEERSADVAPGPAGEALPQPAREAPPLPAGEPFTASETVVVPTDVAPAERAPVRAVFNRTVLTALVLTFGLHLTFGTYEVVWALYLVALGATVAWVGVSFVLFSVPEMIVAPFAGRYIDRQGPLRPIIITGLVIMTTGTIYALSNSYLLSSFVAPVEAAATAAMMPALYTILGRGTPPGRASTTQGLFGATSTLALILASVAAGALFEINKGLPFVFFVIGIAVTMTIGLLLYRTLPAARPA